MLIFLMPEELMIYTAGLLPLNGGERYHRARIVFFRKGIRGIP